MNASAGFWGRVFAWSIGALATSVGAANELGQVRVAAISFVPVKLALEENAARLEALARRAAEGSAKLIVAPEGALDGYVINDVLAGSIAVERLRAVAVSIDDPVIRRFQNLARELGVCLVFGFAEKIQAEIFNTAVFIDHGGNIRGKYHKMLFEEGYHPDWWFNRLGTRSRSFDTPFGRCGILICNDRWNSALARIAALDGAQFLVIPAFGSTSRAQDEAVLQRARETNLPVVEANVGVSLVVDEGKIVALNRAREGVTFADIRISPPREPQPAARDEAEQTFLAWRSEEMQRRFSAKRHVFDGVADRSDALAGARENKK